MASLHGELNHSHSQEGLQVVPQTLAVPKPPSLGHLIIADDSENDGSMPPSDLYVPSPL